MPKKTAFSWALVWSMLLHPNRTMASIGAIGQRQAVILLLVLYGISLAFGLTANIMSGGVFHMSTPFGTTMDVPQSPVLAVLAPVLSLVVVYIAARAVHFVAGKLHGKGAFGKTLFGVGVSMIPTMLVGFAVIASMLAGSFILWAGMILVLYVAMAWSIIVLYYTVKNNYGLSRMNSVLSVIAFFAVTTVGSLPLMVLSFALTPSAFTAPMLNGAPPQGVADFSSTEAWTPAGVAFNVPAGFAEIEGAELDSLKAALRATYAQNAYALSSINSANDLSAFKRGNASFFMIMLGFSSEDQFRSIVDSTKANGVDVEVVGDKAIVRTNPPDVVTRDALLLCGSQLYNIRAASTDASDASALEEVVDSFKCA